MEHTTPGFPALAAGNAIRQSFISDKELLGSDSRFLQGYWNHVYGAQPEEVAKDKEGLMTMYNIGKNMAWLLKCIALGRENGLPHPDNEKVLTNFIR